jgi:ketosteroid isomerase-like protein
MLKSIRTHVALARGLAFVPLLTASALSPIAAHAAAAPPIAGQALLDLETKRFDAQVSRDVAALSAAIADDVVYIHANGATQDKAEYLADVAAGKSRYRSIESSDRSAVIYGATALTHGQMVLNVGVDRRIEVRYTGVYVKRAGHWLVLSWQSTPIAPRQ